MSDCDCDLDRKRPVKLAAADVDVGTMAGSAALSRCGGSSSKLTLSLEIKLLSFVGKSIVTLYCVTAGSRAHSLFTLHCTGT